MSRHFSFFLQMPLKIGSAKAAYRRHFKGAGCGEKLQGKQDSFYLPPTSSLCARKDNSSRRKQSLPWNLALFSLVTEREGETACASEASLLWTLSTGTVQCSFSSSLSSNFWSKTLTCKECRSIWQPGRQRRKPRSREEGAIGSPPPPLFFFPCFLSLIKERKKEENSVEMSFHPSLNKSQEHGPCWVKQIVKGEWLSMGSQRCNSFFRNKGNRKASCHGCSLFMKCFACMRPTGNLGVCWICWTPLIPFGRDHLPHTFASRDSPYRHHYSLFQVYIL